MQLLLAGCVVSDDGMNVTVNEARRECHALRVNDQGRLVSIKVRLLAPAGNLAINRNKAIAVIDGFFQLA